MCRLNCSVLSDKKNYDKKRMNKKITHSCPCENGYDNFSRNKEIKMYM